MGGSRSTSVRQVDKPLPPEQAYERLLREGLQREAQGLLGRLPDYLDRAGRTADNQEAIFGRLPGYLDEGDAAMRAIRSGALPESYEEAFQKGIKMDLDRSIGSTLSDMGQRGIVNSSVTNRGLDEITARAASEAARHRLETARFLAETAYAPVSPAIAAGNAAGGVVDTMAKAAAGTGAFFEPSQSLFDLYSKLRIAQQPDTIVEESGGK